MRFTGGWVKISRKLLSSEWNSALDTIGKGVLLELLLRANYKDSRYVEGTQVKVLKRGQLLIGYRELAEQCKLDRGTLVRRLKILKNSGTIVTQTNHYGTVITICNYDKYQCEENEHEPVTNQRRTNDEPTTNQRRTSSATPNEELKNTKKVKKGEEGPAPLGDWLLNVYESAYEERYRVKPKFTASNAIEMERIGQVLGGEQNATEAILAFMNNNKQFYLSRLHSFEIFKKDFQECFAASQMMKN